MGWKRLFFWRKKVGVQDVFSRVIDAGYYREWRWPVFGHHPSTFSEYMCVSLRLAKQDGVINRGQFRCAAKEIRKYLKGYPSLAGALGANRLRRDFEFRLAIYRNWDNRPTLEDCYV